LLHPKPSACILTIDAEDVPSHFRQCNQTTCRSHEHAVKLLTVWLDAAVLPPNATVTIKLQEFQY